MTERFNISINYEGGELPPEEREEPWDDRYLYVTAIRQTFRDGHPYSETISIAFPDNISPEQIAYRLRVMAMQNRELSPALALSYKVIADQVAADDLGENIVITDPETNPNHPN